MQWAQALSATDGRTARRSPGGAQGTEGMSPQAGFGGRLCVSGGATAEAAQKREVEYFSIS